MTMLEPKAALALARAKKFDDLRKANITRNFKWGEMFVNRSDEQIAQAPADVFSNLLLVARQLQKVRVFYNKPITVSSGWRPLSVQQQLDPKKKVTRSYHIRGLALDFTVAGIKPIDVQHYLFRTEDYANCGIEITGGNWTHIDVRGKRKLFYPDDKGIILPAWAKGIAVPA